MKQAYLKANVMDEGYDPSSFAQFMEYKMGKWKWCFCNKGYVSV